MKIKKNLIQLCLLCAAMLPAVAQAQFTFTTNNGAITITGYTGSGGAVVIPGATNGYPVSAIADYAFYGNSTLTNLTIPSSVTNIGSSAFASCPNLLGVYFLGNAPSADLTAWTPATVPRDLKPAAGQTATPWKSPGPAWFRKSFTLPAAQSGQEMTLVLWVDAEESAFAWINGHELVENMNKQARNFGAEYALGAVLDAVQAARLEGGEEGSPVDFGFTQGRTDAEDSAFAFWGHAHGDEDGAVQHSTFQADLFITRVQDHIRESSQRAIATGG